MTTFYTVIYGIECDSLEQVDDFLFLLEISNKVDKRDGFYLPKWGYYLTTGVDYDSERVYLGVEFEDRYTQITDIPLTDMDKEPLDQFMNFVCRKIGNTSIPSLHFVKHIRD